MGEGWFRMDLEAAAQAAGVSAEMLADPRMSLFKSFFSAEDLPWELYRVDSAGREKIDGAQTEHLNIQVDFKELWGSLDSREKDQFAQAFAVPGLEIGEIFEETEVRGMEVWIDDRGFQRRATVDMLLGDFMSMKMDMRMFDFDQDIRIELPKDYSVLPLGKTRERSYLEDVAMIQTAVDSFFTAADNARYLGLRQFPILGAASTGTTKEWDASGGDGDLPPALLNPLRGTQGGEPKWRDDGNGTRDASEENLNAEADAISGNDTGWFVKKVTFQGKDYAVGTQDYFINFTALVEAGLLQNVPESASPDNGGGSNKGSYSWYVKATGLVESLFFHLPSNSVRLDETTSDGTLDLRGFVDGVYP